MTKLKPLNDRLVVKADKPAEQIGSIVVPDQAQPRATRGTVLEVGPGKPGKDGAREPMDVKVGDAVLFGLYSGTEIELDGEKILLMRYEEVFAVVMP